MKAYHTLPMYYGASLKLFEFAKQRRNEPTKAEEVMYQALKGRLFSGYNFRGQHPIASFIADFYCHSLKLVVEIDGGYHLCKYQKEYDDLRDEDMQALGIEVMRFSNDRVLYKLDNTLTAIKIKINEMQQSRKPSQS